MYKKSKVDVEVHLEVSLLKFDAGNIEMFQHASNNLFNMYQVSNTKTYHPHLPQAF